MISVGEGRFEELVDAALGSIPDSLRSAIDNVAVFVEEDSPAGSPRLFGLYEGIPLTQRDSGYGGVLPDRVTIYRRPILEVCRTEAEVVEQIRVTVVHEIGHHFGIDDHRLGQLGYA